MGRKPRRLPGGAVATCPPPTMPGFLTNIRMAGAVLEQHVVYTTRLESATMSKMSQQSLLLHVGGAAPAFVVAQDPSSCSPKYRSSAVSPAWLAPLIPNSQVACGVLAGCSQSGFWQSDPRSVFRYTPPSDDMTVGQASLAAWESKTRSPMSSWPPTLRVKGPAHDPDAGQRAALPPGGDGV